MKTNKWQTMLTTALAVILSAANGAAEERKDGMRFIPDVIEAFGALSEAPETLGFHITTTPDPSACKHYQGLVRVNGADGTPFFLVTKSGNNPAWTGDGALCDDSPDETGDGYLVVFRMDSRNKTGERMRSNRLQKGKHVNSSVPPVEDRATIFFTVTEDGLVLGRGEAGLEPKTYQHPGGMQVVGNMMVMAMEARRDPKLDCLKSCVPDDTGCPDLCNQIQYPVASWPTMVQFYDVSDPEDPDLRSNFKPTNEHGEALTGCDGIAVTPLPNDRYLLAVTGGFDTEDPIYFYRSRPLGDCADPAVDCTLANENLQWDFVAKRNAPETKDPIQALHFLRQKDMGGTLFLAASNGYPLCLSGDCDRINLFTVNSDTPNFEPGETVTFTVNYRGKRVYTHPSTGGNQIANLAAAAGFYESPTGELILYATEHDNDGPSETVKAGEWRYESIVRGDSPTYLPNLTLDTTQEVNEGSDLMLTGAAGPPITKAWMQVYGIFGSFVVDYDDEGLDDYATLRQFEPGGLFLPNGYADHPVGWHWFAPPGCSIRATDALDDDFDPRPEPRLATVAGTGNYETQTMQDVLDDVNGEDMLWAVDGVGYLSNCDDYYGGPWKVFWDMEGDGSYVGQGDSISFDAFELDGPDTVTIDVQSRHATITGPVGQSSVTITIKNVAPIVAPLALTDPAGRAIGSAVPFILTKVPVTAATTFTDPGIADTQSAELAWGDGVVDLETAFDVFTQATGGEFGEVGHAHRYLTPGSYTVALDVEDDDAGVGTVSGSLLVVSPEQAILDMIARVDVLLAGTTNRDIRKYLTNARRALIGTNPPRTSDGALPMVRAEEDEAAAAFVGVSADWLERAADEGVDVAVLLAIADQLILGLSAQ